MNLVTSIASRAVRVVAVSVAVFTLFTILFHNFDSAPGITPSWPRPAQYNASSGSHLLSSEYVDWSRFAYTQYVTDGNYLCNSVMFFETLHRLGSLPERVLMYPSGMLKDDAVDKNDHDTNLLAKASDEYNVRLVPVTVQHRDSADSTWADSYTKLLAFNQTQYDRVLSLDSDSTLLQPMDELFLLPPTPVAMPRAYWLYPDEKILSSQLMLLQPNAAEFTRVMDEVKNAKYNDYDMEVVNDLYLHSAMILPHRPYTMLSSEFRSEGNHHSYLGTDRETWDPVAALKEAKFVHFSDWPIPKPWIKMSNGMRQNKQPKCHTNHGVVESCVDRDIWNGLYTDFAERRQRICETEA